MRRVAFLVLIVAALLAVTGCQAESQKDYGVVNTPLIISQLAGTWERQVTAVEPTPERLTFKADGSGWIQNSSLTAPANMTYRVDGFQITLQYYFDQQVPHNWRTRTMGYQYRISDDTMTLVLIREGQLQTWRRIKA